ncbi:MAG: M56 family metallopeptidase [Proteiniphilum sp.]
MHPFFIYLLQVNIALALFYLLYASMLKKDTFLRLRRFFFLSAILFSLLYPLFTVPALSNAWMFPTAGTEEGTVITTVTIGEPSMVVIIDNDAPAPVSIPWATILFLLYLSVTLVFISRFFVQLGSIYSIRAKCEKRTISGTTVYHLKEDVTPFSFFNLIFIHEEQHPGTELTQVLLHEQAHVKQAHSVDIVLAELLCIFFWWNPFVWLMKREMIMNLEYLADNDVLLEGFDTREYQYHLLRLTYHESDAPLVNNFNISLLKQRIMMMNKTKSPTLRLVKYLAIFRCVFYLLPQTAFTRAMMKKRRPRVKQVTPLPSSRVYQV